MKNFLNWIIFLFTGKGEIANEAVDEGLIDLSGQGRDKYGKVNTVPKYKAHGCRFDDLSGKTFGIWNVLEFDHMSHTGTNQKNSLSYYKCECSVCGRIFLRSRCNILHSKGVRHRGKCK